jgi:type II secretion system protein G
MRTRGFTLIELLIVVAIISILAAIAVPNFMEAQIRAKVARAKADMRTIGIGLESYRIDCEEYPPAQDTRGLYGYLRRLVPITTPVAYLSSIPEDPFSVLSENWVGYRDPYTTSSANPKPWTFDYSPLGWYNREFGANWEITFSQTNINWTTVQWAMLSLGPDGDWDPFNQAMPLISYDPSNGTVSNGNIIIAGPGHSFLDN